MGLATYSAAERNIAGVRNPRCLLQTPPGTPHQAMNASDTDVEFQVISAPTSSGDRIEVEPAQ